MGGKRKRRTGNIFLNIRPEMQQKMKQPSAYPLGGHADGCVFHQSYNTDMLDLNLPKHSYVFLRLETSIYVCISSRLLGSAQNSNSKFCLLITDVSCAVSCAASCTEASHMI